ncbi:hypothetical protein Hdeb2414_s0026g00681571 [Helianthus debilis subsp. tardiflorus]
MVGASHLRPPPTPPYLSSLNHAMANFTRLWFCFDSEALWLLICTFRLLIVAMDVPMQQVDHVLEKMRD